MIKYSKSLHHPFMKEDVPHLCMDNIQNSNMTEYRKGVVKHFLGHILGDIADVNSQSVLLLCERWYKEIETLQIKDHGNMADRMV